MEYRRFKIINEQQKQEFEKLVAEKNISREDLMLILTAVSLNDDSKCKTKAKDLNEYSLEELQEIQNFGEKELFNSLIIVPSEEIHDSGLRCMKAILVRDGEIVGAVSGWSDVINPNGIGNYGNSFIGNYGNSFKRHKYVPYIGLSIDCLVKSKCVRLTMRKMCKMEDFIYSNMCFYTVEQKE